MTVYTKLLRHTGSECVWRRLVEKKRQKNIEEKRKKKENQVSSLIEATIPTGRSFSLSLRAPA
jgi:hypothetical protein